MPGPHHRGIVVTAEWKPGDLAIATVRGEPGVRIMRTGDPLRPLWHSAVAGGSGVESLQWHGAENVTNLRRLIVIDPEDREQVEGLVEAFRSQPAWYSATKRQVVDDMQAALRSLVAPPKPDEPTGLGAVVYGWAYTDTLRPFVRCASKNAPWMDDGGNGHNWSEIDLERVETEGVTP